MKKFGIVLVILVSVAIGAAAMFFVQHLTPKISAAQAAPKETPVQIVPLEERTINLADPSGTHYLKVTLALQVEGSGDAAKGLAAKEPLLMDAVIDVVSRQYYATLQRSEGRKSLKEQLTERINERLQGGAWQVKEVLFTDFVME